MFPSEQDWLCLGGEKIILSVIKDINIRRSEYNEEVALNYKIKEQKVKTTTNFICESEN